MRKYLFGTLVFALAFVILSVSLMRTSSISYALATTIPSPTPSDLSIKTPEIDYDIPYEGRILPDNPLWTIKAVRDRVWYIFSFNPLKKAELALLFSDKRLLAAKALFESKKPDIALSTLTKGEKYLQIAVDEEVKARNKGIDTTSFLKKLAMSSLKHRQLIEDVLKFVPEDGKPEVIKFEEYSKNAYKSSRDVLNSKGEQAPINPFEGLN
ncbi:MAG TPA: DUF5667 domain-containing protein [Patescibacteria group bacterium]|nr:DUF5667 domain-containing protein [Patescibacteria group bacterium]